MYFVYFVCFVYFGNQYEVFLVMFVGKVDGPYKAMILPASKEEGKRLKKRYSHNVNMSMYLEIKV